MILYIVTILLLFLAGVRIRNNDGGILSQNDTTIINGVFALIILISHSTQYYEFPGGILNSLYLHFKNFHNQWVVTTFLAFSGFGVMSQIMGGGQYVKKYPKNRILKTLINFDIAVLLYLLLNILIGKEYLISEIILSFTGVTGIGNSNWYIFDILIMYIISYSAARLFSNNYVKQAVVVTVGTVSFIVIMDLVGMPSRFISTVSCYALGVWLAVYKEKVVAVIKNKKIPTIAVLYAVLILTYKLRYNDYIMNLASLAFVMVFVWCEVFFELNNKVLLWIGKHAFSIFILQRIPMIVFENYGILVNQPYVFVFVSLVVTIIISIVFDKAIGKMNKAVF